MMLGRSWWGSCIMRGRAERSILAQGGGKPKGVGDVLQGSGVGSTYFWGGDVGDDPPHGTVHWGVQDSVAICITGG